MSQNIKYDKEVFLDKIAKVDVEYEKMASYKKELDQIINGVTDDGCWKGISRGEFKYLGEDACDKFEITLGTIRDLRNTLEKALIIIEEKDDEMAKELSKLEKKEGRSSKK